MSITGVEMQYGYYMLKPAPQITVGREVYRQRNGATLGGGYRVNLNGSLLPSTIEGTGLTTAEREALPGHLPTAIGHQFDGQTNALALLRAKNDFLYAFNKDRELFTTKFLGSGPLCSGTGIYGAPRVVSVEFNSEDNWTNKVDYSVELFFNNSMSTGTGNGVGYPLVVGPDSPLTGIIYGQSGAYDYIEGDLESYSREYSIDMMSKGAQIGSGYLPSFFQVGVSTSLQLMEGQLRNKLVGGAFKRDDPMSWAGAPYSGIRPTIDPYAGVEDYAFLPTDTVPPITLDSQSVIAELVSGYVGTALSGLKGVHTESSYTSNVFDGSYNYNDTFVIYGTVGRIRASGFNLPNYPVMDTPSLDVDGALENAIVSVTLQGELKGFAPFYGDTISGAVGIGAGSNQAEAIGPFGGGVVMSESLANAQRYLDEAAYYGSISGRERYGSGLFYNRACTAYSGLNFPSVSLLPLQPEPISQSISYNTRESSIAYSFTYNNRPPNCFSGALHESITINRGNPSEVHSNLTILGRQKGPILQSIGTITASTTEVNIDATIIPATGTTHCSGDLFFMNPLGGAANTRGAYSGLLNLVEQNISLEYGTYFVTSYTENYDPKTGRYGCNKAWIHTFC